MSWFYVCVFLYVTIVVGIAESSLRDRDTLGGRLSCMFGLLLWPIFAWFTVIRGLLLHKHYLYHAPETDTEETPD